jgi:hypothetical protein
MDTTPPAGEWNADQILAHVAVVNAATISTVSAINSGTHTTYDNRVSQDAWTLAHVIEVAGGNEGLRERVRAQGEALCVLAGPILSETELDTLVPARMVSKDTILFDQPMPLWDILTGLADVERPLLPQSGHSHPSPSSTARRPSGRRWVQPPADG